MKKRIRQMLYILFAIAAFVLLIVVVTNSQSPESLMVPPEAAGDYKEIQDVIKTSVEGGIILKAPDDGDYPTAITFYDINLDGENDALAFYRLKNDDSSAIYMSVLFKKGSKWAASQPIKGKGDDILEFTFGDLNYDSIPEIIVGWGMFESRDNNSLCVYSVDTNQKKPVIHLNDSLIYTKMFVDDICLEGKKEILLIKNMFSDASSPATASVYELEDGKLKARCQVDMLSRVSDYKQTLTQTIASKKVFFLDGVMDKVEMITEILYWDETEGAIVHTVSAEDGQSTLRQGTMTCLDINADGIAEIPFNSPEEDEQTPVTYWKNFEFDGFSTVAQSICTEELIFVFPYEWNEKVCAVQNGNIITFYDESTGDKIKLFDLVSCDIASWKSLSGEYEQLKIDYGTIYGVKYADSNSDLTLNKNEIKQAIINIR